MYNQWYYIQVECNNSKNIDLNFYLKEKSGFHKKNIYKCLYTATKGYTFK